MVILLNKLSFAILSLFLLIFSSCILTACDSLHPDSSDSIGKAHFLIKNNASAYYHEDAMKGSSACVFLVGSLKDNKPYTKDRLNFVVVNYGLNSSKDYKKIRNGIIGLDNEDYKYSGILATEPYKSNKDQIDFFYLTKSFQIEPANAQQSIVTECGKKKLTYPLCSDACPLPDMSYFETCSIQGPIIPIVLCNTKCTPNSDKGKGVFLRMVKSGEYYPATATHELGHVFGLTDEYVKTKCPKDCSKEFCADNWPNCVSLSKAKQWWLNYPKAGFYKNCGNTLNRYKPHLKTIMDEPNYNSGYGYYNIAYICAGLNELIPINGICNMLPKPKSADELDWDFNGIVLN